ncbi:bifunctional 23S rRNA (guanine(2069)-N(7))-methyltransferase RlmK/23S rRNA (guanine(2445)-N(2))-methyltransferase RlmL [Permianibacter aggregans]|uniref:Ribosomal RNA large subunit methyltransferase K/L n=1 Tax=Permianibacter aggregans TaxID=1510150 RepID=A0A4V6PWM3_9GAMM|nr:bifunctional 23S rRNA (guanine(2069)-N(7))-methyltransferase RlmK/23S rRNA (guanine(2445)-N(2))-methyltransferase RlmL [Permianibacter aggregans]QGX41162.1 bifunctional 23S rRNA (guanine(2069)-N(7))-methyltransferase RlmK/23S rRNA (guanine(2445)-N(2))-methyltransferase RlmL [Permianibacter aggregans]TDQ44527.1 23S rRNA m(2)G-2445 methyltransferase [Permianibacter aggregans]
MRHQFFAPCAKGLEYLLVDELKALGAEDVHEALAGVHFAGTLAIGYRAVLWSRLASRILLVLKQSKAPDIDAFYDQVRSIDWLQHLPEQGSLCVDFTGSNAYLKHTQFGAQKVKDAIVDQHRARGRARPDVDTEQPTVRINTHVHRDDLTVTIDLSGHALHERGYRPRAGLAPIKETLAAAILQRAHWPAAAAEGKPLVDPCCGAGTLVIEAALMAADIAPGLFREDFGFNQGWLLHDDALWTSLLNEAEQRAEQGVAAVRSELFGFDADIRVLQMARKHAERAGIDDFVQFERKPIANLQKPIDQIGIVVANPPYGERLGEVEALTATYQELGETLYNEFQGWQAAVITSEPVLAKAMHLRSHKQYAMYNGALACKLYLFDINEQSRWQPPEERELKLSEGAEAFRNRLQKNRKHLASWLKREDVHCYRVYDADLPEYAAAIDVYGDQLLIQEYQAPSKIPEAVAQRRLRELVQVATEVFGLSPERVQLRTRAKQKGLSQYEKIAEAQHFEVIEEGGLKFWVNLQDYLDTGLFLDHRITRTLIRERAAGKRFLNLFSYTGSVSVYAAAGGAHSTTSVDMSRTYSDWAMQNFELNQLDGPAHQFVQADVMQWLPTVRESFDLIFIDPPTFSNSKRMTDVFDVQRDHVELLRQALQRLAPGGELIFSNNFRRFVLDRDALADCEIEDWSRKTLPMDFARNPRIHQCWRIRPR